MPEDFARVQPVPPGSETATLREALDEWIEAVNHGSIDSITALYAPDAVLLGTYEPKIQTTPVGIEKYFTNFKARKNLEASIGECHIELLGDAAAMANGLYIFSFEENGEQKSVTARFTFVYARQPEGDWLIAAHHSSVSPVV